MSNQPVMDRPRVISSHRNISSHRPVNSQKQVYKRWLHELWAGDPVVDELVSEDFVGHWPNRDVHGPAELQTIIDSTRGRLRELAFVIDVGPFIDGDLVAARWIATGSGKDGPARFTGNDILRVIDNKVVEYWAGSSRG
ncbi:SnoaL-like polyketide cyclase [Mycolicibacterium chubuense NBB4]|uniref:SnoaL-like polyketide cyclase n=1 Tax=Mycolicibacterium chubuense (strain NBB4) TaxID=710421 RepID=I4BDV5_MYCCN|nr:nuclear transport factor 2 family protein [Mycolicibacterium chubuense]AFM15462.1 SnoaL-like polyketide cyclase [Mycolicibacterium chubuense NBB4]